MTSQKNDFLDFSVLDDEKHPQPKLGGNRFMGTRDMAA